MDNTLDYALALSVAPLFRLNSERANDILHAIRKSVARWRNIATKLNISNREIDEMAPAFRG